MDTSETKKEHQTLKRRNYLLTYLIVLGVFAWPASLIRLYFTPQAPVTAIETSSILISIFISLMVAQILQHLRDNRLLNTINDSISEVISTNVLNEVGQIRYMRNSVLPSTLYVSKEDKLIDDQINCFSKSSNIRFMSISALHLLEKTIPQIIDKRKNLNIKDDFKIELLLLDPTNTKLIKNRSNQLFGYGETKTPYSLKEEIIGSIIKSHKICYSSEEFHIKIRLHSETPFCRVEFSDGTLYLSFYESQKSEKKLGPVSKYMIDKEEGTDIYRSFLQYYRDSWDQSGKEIEVEKYKTTGELKVYLKNIMNDNETNKIIDSIPD